MYVIIWVTKEIEENRFEDCNPVLFDDLDRVIQNVETLVRHEAPGGRGGPEN